MKSLLKYNSHFNKHGKTLGLLFAFIVMSFTMHAQIDNSSGSFKIPAVEDSAGTPTPVPADLPKAQPDIPASRGGLTLDSDGKLVERPTLKAPESTNFYMLKLEDFADAGQRYTDIMNEREANRTSDRSEKPAHQSDQDLGTFHSGAQQVKIMCRDYQFVDGDRVAVLVNDEIVVPSIWLTDSWSSFYIPLKPGFNRISFKALNQGSSGPNTAAFIIYDDAGNVINSNEWNLLTGVKANLMIVKE
ncbi:hypothetical protein DSM03_102379 [Leeuwenhoekiella aestuarii]|uniref:Secreted protein n=1 Tax=Leeuwenhoekiella aestuarii TaxID=2249426 RepID=A0A4Q0NUL0_9FLAO|nr:hypothetical protein [Leeuwenhoekiella aestuarii]RXG15391.1 hypothetical protein DSM04_103279 [Leeuwenhoekiella aestuarii]RXG17502.1 hypothetical protein DSM03_102379 [Leeuwenhoekiella aestuarii]